MERRLADANDDSADVCSGLGRPIQVQTHRTLEKNRTIDILHGAYVIDYELALFGSHCGRVLRAELHHLLDDVLTLQKCGAARPWAVRFPN